MKSGTSQNLALVTVCAALLVAMQFVYIPVGTFGIPLVLQNTAIILVGLILGPRRGVVATALFLGVGILGIPVLPGGRSVLAALAGPSAGYLVGYLLSAAVAGACGRWYPLGGIAGLLAQYLCGSLGLMLRGGMDLTPALLANVAFLPVDGIELFLVVGIAYAVRTALPQLRRNA